MMDTSSLLNPKERNTSFTCKDNDDDDDDDDDDK